MEAERQSTLASSIGRIYELGEEQTSEVYTVSCSTKYAGLEQFWA